MSKDSLAEPCIIVIFGITGDLAHRKLLPALESLFANEVLSPQTTIIGVTRQSIGVDDLLGQIAEITGKDNPFPLIKERLVVQTMNMTNGDDYDKLLKQMNQIEDSKGVCMNRLYYLSIPPQFFSPIVRLLGERGLNASCPHNVSETRLLIEKPFGYDTKSAEELINDTTKSFKEEQIFRVDHYLAKETVQNILTFRFNNSIFDSLWDRDHIQEIKIVAYEKLGIEGRNIFYEQTGALRDLIQSHLMQLLAIVTMEHPSSIDSKSLHESKLKLLQDIETIPEDRVDSLSVRGQYKTYRDEVNNQQSIVETFAGVKLNIDNDRWRGVPMILESGKALDERKAEVIITFKSDNTNQNRPNNLIFRIQPNEGIGLALVVKKPGLTDEIQPVTMDFSYSHYFNTVSDVGPYEKVLTDAIKGDRTLFTTSAEVMESWRVLNEVLLEWSKNGDSLKTYDNDSAGPHKRFVDE